MDYPICNLCKTNPAIQENSHILPRFLKKEYIKTNKKFFLFNTSTKKGILQQDLPKEDNILCPICERRFQTLESKVSLHLNNSYTIFKRKDYPKFNLLDYEYQLLRKCDPKIFTLFVYSLIWRLHISKHLLYKDYILPDNCAEDLRRTLNKIVPENINEINSNLILFDHQRWDYIFIKPAKRTNFYHNINYNDNIKNMHVSIVFIFEYAIIFLIKRNMTPKFLENYINYQFNETKLMIMDNKTWNDNSMKIARSMIK